MLYVLIVSCNNEMIHKIQVDVDRENVRVKARILKMHRL